VTKQTNSCFYGEPDLHAWLKVRELTGFAVCGIQTNHCVETTARRGGNLGYDVLCVGDACHTFDRRGPTGELMSADDLTRATLTSLHGEFADCGEHLRAAPGDSGWPQQRALGGPTRRTRCAERR
jgi:nicotinamidase-related amidase